MPISQKFFTYKKINNIFFKVRPFFIKDAKNHRNWLNHSCQKTRFKSITKVHINRFGRLNFSSLKEGAYLKLGTILSFTEGNL